MGLIKAVATDVFRGYPLRLLTMYDGLELFFTGLLVLTTLAIVAVAGIVIYRLFAGQK